ncbi:MAG: flagellar biosynthesis protein FlhB [Proteobacteria bacterium]|uniref:Flagellar biosynthetic protein FlhB n=1 Tax=Candidatus Avisuccinivibrio stercorigallinarum TaxID=2840704 RepID=A0A9D9DCS9_9GAMM|nr:flagellar biosynthesis protein FlhB [Candidatus Avisuccinivibrio stercorigallinarum]
MAESDQEKTEQPTSKRLSDARKRGQIPRSREAATFLVLLSGVLSLWAFSSYLGTGMLSMMRRAFSLTRDEVFTTDEMQRIFVDCLSYIALPLLCICVMVLCFAFVGSIFLGGISFSQEAMMPKLSKLNPISGIARMFSLNSMVELIKSIAKVSCIGCFCWFLLSGRFEQILQLSYIDPLTAISEAIELLFNFMLIIVCAMIPIVLIDVPFQQWNYKKQLRMTKQEIKDEYKDSEGNPEIKGRIRRLQYQMAARRMMAKVPTADVVVTNPTHYAVALSYDPNGETAPLVVAKGVDEVAEKIKDIARECGVPVMPLPPLARSLYYTTELDHEIPRGLFKAVAQVLAWVLGMKAYKEGRAPNRPRDLDPNLEIPDELRF